MTKVMAWVFYTVIGRHLSRFASFLQKDNPAENDSSFSLDSKTSRKDELALVVDHFNDMRQKMRRSILEIQEWHDLMDYIIRHDPNAIAVYDRDMRYIFVSWKYIEDHRLNGLEVIGRTCYEVFPELKDKWEDIHQSVLAGEDLSREDDLIVHGDGTTDDVSWQYHPLKDKNGHINGLIYYGVITTERKRMERALFIEKEQFRTTLFSVGDGIISTDKYGKVVLMNKVAEELTGWIFDEAIGNPMEMVFNIVNENTLDSCGNPVEKVLETGEIVELANKTMLISRTGNAIPIEDSAAPILDQEGNITGVVLVFRDCTDKRKKQKEIEYLSYHDQLTGLYNRRFFDEELKRLDVPRNLPLTLVMIDVNGLKLINDAFGHPIGDMLLKAVGDVLSDGLRADDIIARIGGDEFAVLMPGTDFEQTGSIMERITEIMAREKVENIPLSLSFGWETKTSEDENIGKVFDAAEDRMYSNKISEKGSFHNKSVKLIIQTLHATIQGEYEHSNRVGEICDRIGQAMGFCLNERNELKTAGALHDIGKVGINKDVLEKKGPLNSEEWEEIKRHPEISYNILSTVSEYASLAEIILSHHERWDGKGYPRNLKGEDIPLKARIIAVADSYDAMTSERPYHGPMSKEKALEELEKCAGTQFDPEIVKVFIENEVASEVFELCPYNAVKST
jgi:diguanylate cyclase (GGDEF)-like protein/PAS domain S-box-containing protein